VKQVISTNFIFCLRFDNQKKQTRLGTSIWDYPKCLYFGTFVYAL